MARHGLSSLARTGAAFSLALLLAGVSAHPASAQVLRRDGDAATDGGAVQNEGSQSQTGTSDIIRREALPDTMTEERDDAPHYESHQHPPEIDPATRRTEFDREGFRPDPTYPDAEYNVEEQLEIYGGKTAFDTPRPLIELGYPQYSEGVIGTGHDIIGERNLVRPQLLAYGDFRTAVAFNDNGNAEIGQIATRLNLDIDLRLTATERIHMFLRPLDQGGQFTRTEFFGDDGNGAGNDDELILDGNIETLFFEGDIGAIQGGLMGEWASYDLPFSFGLMPLFFQNGVWVDDAFTGVAFAIPAMNSPTLDISNMDISFFTGFDDVSTAALQDADGALAEHAGHLYGAATFIETREMYVEAGYGYVEDQRTSPTLSNFDYQSLTAAVTQRFGDTLSNSVRGVWTFGQDPVNDLPQTADGFALLVENSLITHLPSTLVPYGNFFIGLDRPQPLARGNDGLLKNTGISFESDALTGFPFLDPTAQDAIGGAVGVEYLFDLTRQIVVEAATVQPFGGQSDTILGDQYALSARYQHNLTDRWLLRSDIMRGWLDNSEDIFGITLEIRRKF